MPYSECNFIPSIAMLMHSFRRNMHQATLLTGDLDFKPLIDALVQDGMFITLWYPQNATSDELITAADARLALNIQSIHRYFSKNFERRFPTPRVFLSPDRRVENYSLVTTAQNNHDITVELYQSDRDYLVIFADTTEWSNNLYHLSCPDLERLRRFAEDLYRVKIPLDESL